MEGKILYIHGMGGGEDSRIPSILSASFDVVVRTYSFDPELARTQIASWIDELKPVLLIGESLGAVHTLYFSSRRNIPCILVSPALNTPVHLRLLAPLTLVPGVRGYFLWRHKPRSERRQRLVVDYKTLNKWYPFRADALSDRDAPVIKAFFGRHDHYRKSGVVSIKGFSSRFGDVYEIYDGTHYMEEEFIESLLIPEIDKALQRLL